MQNTSTRKGTGVIGGIPPARTLLTTAPAAPVTPLTVPTGTPTVPTIAAPPSPVAPPKQQPETAAVPVSFVPLQVTVLTTHYENGLKTFREIQKAKVASAPTLATAIKEVVTVEEFQKARGSVLHLVFETARPVASVWLLANEIAKAPTGDAVDVYLTANPHHKHATAFYTVPLTFTEVGKQVPIMPVTAKAAEGASMVSLSLVSGGARGEYLLLPMFYRNRDVLKAIMRFASPPTLPATVRALIAPFATQQPTASLASAIKDVTTALAIAEGTALYHSTGYIEQDGIGSHTHTGGAVISDATSDANVRREFRELLRTYPMLGTVALTTRRPVNATARNGIAMGMYYATRRVESAEFMPDSGAAARFYHVVAPSGNFYNDEFVANLQELTDRMRDMPANAGSAIVVWDALPESFNVIDGTVDATLVFVQPTESMRSSFLPQAINLFTCTDSEKKPAMEIIYTMLPQYMTNIREASTLWPGSNA